MFIIYTGNILEHNIIITIIQHMYAMYAMYNCYCFILCLEKHKILLY